MHISSLALRNFRNFRKARLQFKNGINTIIGENGSGKTNLFYALRLLIDDSLPRYALNNFNPTDFSRSLGPWEGHWIIIGVEFAELDEGEDAQAIALHTCGNMDVADRGSLVICFRPKRAVRQSLFEYSQTADKTQDGLRGILSALTVDDYETVGLCRGTGDICDDEIYKLHVGDFEGIVFPDPATLNDNVFGTRTQKSLSIHSEVSCTFIKALRDVESDLRSYAKNPLLNLLRGKEKTVNVANQEELQTDIRNLNQKINTLDELVDLKQGITGSINEAVGKTYAPAIDIRSDLPDEMDRLFQSLKLWVADAEDEDYHGRIWELSLGGANLIYLSLKLLEYEKVKTDRIANFLLIEEPEAHVHTHIQKTLFENLPAKKTQVIVSTHSTHISSASKIGSVNILSRGNQESAVYFPSNELSDADITKIERYLDAIRSTLLFAKGVILVEGDAEMILIPEMFKQVFGLSLDEIGVSLINIGSTRFSNVAKLFDPKRIMKNCAILTDSDASVVTLPADPNDDTPDQKHYRASQESGSERITKLTEWIEGNDYIKLFYANNTFEVDFLAASNTREIKGSLDQIYALPARRDACILRLDDESLEVSGVEVLRLANKVGKGWFALLLAERLSFTTNMPGYILSAIAFASSHINLACQKKAASYRVEMFRSDPEHTCHGVANGFDVNIGADEFVSNFQKSFPDDQLSELIQIL